VAKFSSSHSQAGVGATELNSMASAAVVQSTTVVDNTTNLDPWAAIQGSITFNVAPTISDSNTIDVYAQPAWTGTTYQTVLSGNLPQGALYLTSLPVKSTATTQVMASAPFPMPGPIVMHLILQNNTGTALAASAGTVSVYSWQTQ
jgi:hypothetical protein